MGRPAIAPVEVAVGRRRPRSLVRGFAGGRGRSYTASVLSQSDERRLVAGARTVGVDLAPLQVRALSAYAELLTTWNRRINLTALDSPSEVVDRHFVDSLALSPLLPREASLLDVGSGGGFPGAVVALVRPDLRVTLCESRGKRVAFLQALVSRLRLGAKVVAARSEDLAREHRLYDGVVSRAVLPLAEWVAHGSELVGPGGLLLAMVGPAPAELPAIAGFGPAEVVPYRLPDGVEHTLLRWRRLSPA
jgi:16S rRNA (guanine527-N7)-methyltransferase